MLRKQIFEPPTRRFFCVLNMGKEFLITIPQRGLKVIPPTETQANMRIAKEGGIAHWSQEERARLYLLTHCRILEKRHPKPVDGKTYMESVDMERREYLLSLANELSRTIADEWHRISPDSEVAVILYGSVAKGLTRGTNHPDPSNIDLSVVGNISDEEKTQLFNRIRQKRTETQKKILEGYGNVESSEQNPGNAGVIIQNIDKLRKERYGVARTYIAGGAIALYDPAGIWKAVEEEALKYQIEKINQSKTKKNTT